MSDPHSLLSLVTSCGLVGNQVLTRPPRFQGFVPPMKDRQLLVHWILNLWLSVLLWNFHGPLWSSRTVRSTRFQVQTLMALLWAPEGSQGSRPLERLRQFDSSSLSVPAPILVFVSAFGLPVQGYQRHTWFRTLCRELASRKAHLCGRCGMIRGPLLTPG